MLMPSTSSKILKRFPCALEIGLNKRSQAPSSRQIISLIEIPYFSGKIEVARSVAKKTTIRIIG